MPNDQQDRRMDALARICVSPSTTCVAVCCIGKEFYITANSLYSSDSEDQSKDKGTKGKGRGKFEALVKNLWEHFYGIGDHTDIQKTEKHYYVFQQICSYERVKDERGVESGKHTKEIHDAAIEWSLAHRDLLPAISVLKKRHGHNMGDVGYAYGFVMDLHTDLQKIEDSLKDIYPEGDDDIKFTPDNFKKLPTIVTEEDQGGVHAEVQMLSKIIKMIRQKDSSIKNNSTIYVGISRNCCLECHYMLEAAKEILKEQPFWIALDFRGSHDIPQKSKWKYPKLFQEISDEEDIAYKIKILTNEKITQAIETASKHSINVSMGAAGSDSEPEENAQQKLTLFLEWLDTLEKNIRLFDGETSILEVRSFITLGKELQNLKAFTELFQHSKPAKIEQAERTFESIVNEYDKNNQHVLDRNRLFAFIKKPWFSGSIANYFANLLEPPRLQERSIGSIDSEKNERLFDQLQSLEEKYQRSDRAMDPSSDHLKEDITSDTSNTTENTTPRSWRFDRPPLADGETTTEKSSGDSPTEAILDDESSDQEVTSEPPLKQARFNRSPSN